MDKPEKPNAELPNSFGGIKQPFSENMIKNGFEPDIKQLFQGDNLNDWLDKTGKKFEYIEKIADFVNGLPIDNVMTTDANNKLVYLNKYQLKETTPYTILSGNVDVQGNPDVVSYSGNTVSFKVGGLYPDLKVTNASGEQSAFAGISPLVIINKYKNIVTGANAIGDNMSNAGNVFDKNISTYSISTVATSAGNASLGQKNLTENVDYIRIYQSYTDINRSLSSVRLQYSLNGTDWLDIQTVSLAPTANVWSGYIKVNSYPQAQFFRILSNSTVVSGVQYAWAVGEIEMFTQADDGTTDIPETLNIGLEKDGTGFYYKNQFTQASTPVNAKTNDIWLDTSKEPLSAHRWFNSQWVTFDGTHLGTIKLEEGVVTSVQCSFNQNGYNINTNTKGWVRFLSPDLSKPMSIVNGATFIAPSDGWIYVSGNVDVAPVTSITINDIQVFRVSIDVVTNVGYMTSRALVEKGDIVYATGTSIKFYPTKQEGK